MKMTSIWWIRRDLRLNDNQALQAAMDTGGDVLPVFIVDSRILKSSNQSPRRNDFLWAGLRELDDGLKQIGGYLVIRRGNPLEQLTNLVQETQASSIFAEEDFSPYSQNRDKKINKNLPLHLTGGLTVSHPASVVKPDGTPYTVYTPYKRAWKAQNLPIEDFRMGRPVSLSTPADIKSESIPEVNSPDFSAIGFIPGEEIALQKLDEFRTNSSGGITNYRENRNRMDLPGTSGLSPYLKFGMIAANMAIKTAVAEMDRAFDQEARENVQTWLDELIWREFYISILFHFPDVLNESFRKSYRNIEWRNDELEFEAWCSGLTGYPIVDAGMRQLEAIGWMHNRARMITASFLVKDLLVDWRWGESWFMQSLIDGDLAANNGGWQWTAGTGTDAAPYFRIFNPIRQGKKFDPKGHYIRKWVPELENVPIGFINSPWEMPADIQQKSRCVIGKDYPFPIVDHAYARERVLEVFKQARLRTE